MMNPSLFNFEKILIKIGIKKSPKVNGGEGPVAISVKKLEGSTIEGNEVYGIPLLKADEIKDSSVKNNKTYK